MSALPRQAARCSGKQPLKSGMFADACIFNSSSTTSLPHHCSYRLAVSVEHQLDTDGQTDTRQQPITALASVTWVYSKLKTMNEHRSITH